MSPCRFPALCLLALAVLLLSFQDALAHRINIFATVEAQQIRRHASGCRAAAGRLGRALPSLALHGLQQALLVGLGHAEAPGLAGRAPAFALPAIPAVHALPPLR